MLRVIHVIPAARPTGGWLAVIGRAASPSETARVNIIPQVRDEVKWPPRASVSGPGVRFALYKNDVPLFGT